MQCVQDDSSVCVYMSCIVHLAYGLLVGLGHTLLYKEIFTARLTLNSCLRGRATMMRASDASNTRQNGKKRLALLQQMNNFTCHNVCYFYLVSLHSVLHSVSHSTNYYFVV